MSRVGSKAMAQLRERNDAGGAADVLVRRDLIVALVGDIDDLTEVCKLVVSAAAKQTIGAQRIRAAAEINMVPSGSNMQRNNASAVGRLHNAAKRARAILPDDVVAEIEAAAGGEEGTGR